MDNKKNIKETTGAASSGAYEAPFGGESEIESPKKVKLLDIYTDLEESYTLAATKGEVQKKGAGSIKDYELPKDDNKGDLPDSYEFDFHEKENERIEAHKNTMLDIEYDNISGKAREINQREILKGKGKDVGNAVESEIPEQLIDDSKKRVNSRNRLDNITQLGSDIEVGEVKNSVQPKHISESIDLKESVFIDKSDVEWFIRENFSHVKDGTINVSDEVYRANVLIENWNIFIEDFYRKDDSIFKKITQKNNLKKLNENAYFHDFFKKVKNKK